MGDIHYMISEAAKVVGVEAHVLRYWEEELTIEIGRTEMDHRYYTEDNLQLFQCIRKLKEEGVSLKELKVLVPEIQAAKKLQKIKIVEEVDRIPKVDSTPRLDNIPKVERVEKSPPTSKLETLLEHSLKKNNVQLEANICQLVTESIKKEMTCLLDAKEQLEEERYRKLDNIIRQQQVYRKENAKQSVGGYLKHAFGI